MFHCKREHSNNDVRNLHMYCTLYMEFFFDTFFPGTEMEQFICFKMFT
jgi:hypothetical protein